MRLHNFGITRCYWDECLTVWFMFSLCVEFWTLCSRQVVTVMAALVQYFGPDMETSCTCYYWRGSFTLPYFEFGSNFPSNSVPTLLFEWSLGYRTTLCVCVCMWVRNSAYMLRMYFTWRFRPKWCAVVDVLLLLLSIVVVVVVLCWFSLSFHMFACSRSVPHTVAVSVCPFYWTQ